MNTAEKTKRKRKRRRNTKNYKGKTENNSPSVPD